MQKTVSFLMVAWVSLWVVQLAAASGPTNTNKRPNIVFLMADDQCTYSMGCYGTPGVRTPNLDRLAGEGMVFDNHYDTTAICMGSRANVMTGKYEYKTGCNFSHGPLLTSTWQKSYPVLLRKAGYRTAFAGKFGFEVVSRVGGKRRLPKEAFDTWGGGPGQTSYRTRKNPSIAHYAKEFPHSTRAYGAFGRDFILKAAKEEQPFCLSISFKAPHRPVSPDPAFDDVYRGQTFTKPANYGRRHGLHFSAQSRQGRQYPRFRDWKYDRDYDGVMAKYYQQVYAIDVALGMIRKALKESGAASNTVIIYTSDNGFLCGSHGYGSKVLPYEEASRVPLIIHDPRHANSGKKLRSRALTGNIDFAPTLLALAGLTAPAGMDGRSLLPLYNDPKASIRDSLLLINVWGPAPTHSLSVVTKDWKYIFWNYAAAPFRPTEELYHTAADPLELKNLAQAGNANASESLRRMRVRYDAAVDHWKKHVVSYHDYSRFGTILDRRIPWSRKIKLVRQKK